MGIKTGFLKYAALAGALAILNGVVQAGPIFTGSSGNRAASAQFDVSGTNLVVTLTNTSAFDVSVPVDVLTALFFTIAGDPTLTPVSAMLASGSMVFYDPNGQPAGGNVGGEWAYKDGIPSAPHGADEGISSTGVGLFDKSNFNGPELAGPANNALNGLQYGILSAGDDTVTGNPAILGSGGLIKNSVVFTLSGLPQNFSLYDQNTTKISNVSFQYGTSLTEPNITGGCTQNCIPPCTVNCGGGTQGIPEPASLGLLGLGLLAIGVLRRRQVTRV